MKSTFTALLALGCLTAHADFTNRPTGAATRPTSDMQEEEAAKEQDAATGANTRRNAPRRSPTSPPGNQSAPRPMTTTPSGVSTPSGTPAPGAGGMTP